MFRESAKVLFILFILALTVFKALNEQCAFRNLEDDICNEYKLKYCLAIFDLTKASEIR